MNKLQLGLVGTASLLVEDRHTAPHLGSGRAPVLASPIMIASMEAAAVDCIEQLLPEGQESLGVFIEVEHTAPTPVGLRVTARAELTQVSGRKLVFNVEATDEREIIGKGRHIRVVVDSARFRAKAAAKRPSGE